MRRTARIDVDAALQHVDSALALAPDASAHAVRARGMATLDLDGAEADAAEAIALGGGSQALEVGGWVAYYRRQYDQARTYADAGADAATEQAIELSCRAVGAAAFVTVPATWQGPRNDSKHTPRHRPVDAAWPTSGSRMCAFIKAGRSTPSTLPNGR